MQSSTQNLVWFPQEGPQHALVDCMMPEIFWGGSRGGGKTDGVIGKWAIKEAMYGRAFNAMMFRRSVTSSVDAIDRSKEIYGPLGGQFNESKLTWRMPNGGRVGFGYLDSVQDAQNYQGRNLTDAWVEEVGQYPDPAPIDRLYGVLRSAHGVPVQLILSGNPGGPGQSWLASRYKLIPFPLKPRILSRRLPNKSLHYFAVIPSRITDNKIMLDADPRYVDRLHMVGSKALVEAWLNGDWGAVEGAFFDTFSLVKHVVPRFPVPPHWIRFRSGDWGSAKPYAFLWFAVVPDPFRVGDITMPRGALLVYRELYGRQKDKPNVGLKQDAETVADLISAAERGETISYGHIDPAATASDGGPSIVDRMARRNVHWDKADNTRIARGGGRMVGWDLVRARLNGDNGVPMIYFSEDCVNTIRTLPVVQHDQSNPEDLDTDSEDHLLDALRYGCASRPWIPSPPESITPRDRHRGEQRATSDPWAA